MTDIVISGTGLYTPPESISNEELVASFNAYVEIFNREHAAEIAAGDIAPLQPSSAEFIEKASGIKARYVVNKDGILDPRRMVPRLPERPNEDQSIQCEMAVAAAREAMAQARKSAADIGIAELPGLLRPGLDDHPHHRVCPLGGALSDLGQQRRHRVYLLSHVGANCHKSPGLDLLESPVGVASAHIGDHKALRLGLLAKIDPLQAAGVDDGWMPVAI